MDAQVPAVAACALFSALAAGQTASFNLVGLPQGTAVSFVYGLSADGSVAAGSGYNSSASFGPGFTWTLAGGRNDFGLLPGMPPTTDARAISGDGTTVVGGTRTGDFTTSHAYRRIGDGPIQDLGLLGSYTRSNGTSVSGNGSVVVGYAERGTGAGTVGQAFRWTAQGGMQGLGFVSPGSSYSQALGVSRDGSTIIGTNFDAAGNYGAFMWTAGGGMQLLPYLPGGSVLSAYGRAANADGTYAVGDCTTMGFEHHGVLWHDGIATDIGTLAGFGSSLETAVSDNGSIVVGWGADSQSEVATVWTPDTGMVPLSNYLSAHGIAIPVGWQLQRCLAISGDGQAYGGIAYNGHSTQGFVAIIPAPATPLLAVLLLVPTSRRRR